MDITHLFKASVMAIKLERRSEMPVPDKKRILKKTPRDEFAKLAREICHKITTLRNVLIENRSAYMRIGQHLKTASQMSDEQRDLIDRESEKFVIYYTQHLAQMRNDWKKIKRKSKQHYEHIECVLDLLSDYLKSVHQIFIQQKNYRIHHELETYRLLKLAADKKKIPIRPVSDRSRTLTVSSWEGNQKCRSDASGNFSDGERKAEFDGKNSKSDYFCDSDDDYFIEKSSQVSRKLTDNNALDVKSQSRTSQKMALDEDIQKSEQLVDDQLQTETLNADDMQMFEEENMQLYLELQGLSEEVEQIGKNVVDIAQLQDIFTEKVSMQQQNIERIANAVVGATENVKDANEQIKQAIQRNAGLRVWSLFFLLVMSFALLFLDWYYE